ncbi:MULTISPECIES: hypothetical protein [Paenibacillus]|uniref:hypothetical protein n=1 Tax=Paenibacillus TaxID=44249 RepID=UPI0022B89089|nr:hypothetical protein [Paenibacillus caseinilyticus]MCZ8523809.1 hypothetical protein [Paenibacillus caseinilyticus]
MNAADFNRLYEDIVIKKLQEQGYATKGQSLFFQKETTVAALLRSTFRGEQGSDIVFCIRHAFLREHLKLTNGSYPMDAIDYPFRFSIKSFKQEDLFKVTYTPINYLRPRSQIPYESIYYGDTAVEDSKGLTNQLNEIADNVVKFGPLIMNILSPKKAFDCIARNNKDAWIEKIWLEDYSNKLT